MTKLKDKFRPEEWNMIQDYSQGELKGLTWFEIANMYGIKKLGTKDQKTKGANDVWRKYKKLISKIKTPVTVNKQNPKILIMDIETSYNIVKSWGLGKTFLNHLAVIRERGIITVAYKWLDSEESVVLQWDNDQCDKKLVEEIAKVMHEADEIVGHNIDNYDIPFIKSRAIFHRIPMLPKYVTTDTLKLARKFRLNSRKLDFITDFLDFGRKVEHRGISMWDDIILRKCPKAMEEMIEYNIKDITLTEDVYKEFMEYSEAGIHHTVLNGGEKHQCPKCGNDNAELLKTYVSKAGTKSRLMSCSCGTKFKLSETLYNKNYA